MIELINNLSPYAPLVICVASFLDIFFATGLILYGAAMMGSVAVMHATGMISVEGIVLATFIGTMTGNSLNYYVGRKFGDLETIKKRLANPKIKTFTNLLEDRGLLVFIIVSRFITVTRPIYATLLGSLKIPFRRFIIFESIVALTWISFWLFIIIKGEQIYFWIFS